jgi:hypothetical protein
MVMLNNQALEGTWEEILAHGAELAGHRVRLTVLANETTPQSSEPTPQKLDQVLDGFLGTVSFETPSDLTLRSGDYFTETLLEKQQNYPANP